MLPFQTLTRFIRSQERKHPEATGELSDLLSSLALGVKVIGNLVQTAGFKGLQGYTDHTNVHGETTRQLDEEADRALVDLLSTSGHFGSIVSEERDTVVQSEQFSTHAKYVVAFDPLDGSSNVGSNIPVGTIFTVFRRTDMNRPPSAADFLQRGRTIIAAGYAVYGAKLSFVYSCGEGVHGFTLDPTLGEFVLTEQNIRTPQHGSTYSANEGNSFIWSDKLRSYVNQLKADHYSLRYVGSLVADFDRILRNGGVFLYPSDARHPSGKLRLLYECVPLAFIMEQAGGKAVDGGQAILDIEPENIHARSPFIVGSAQEVEKFMDAR